MEKRFMGMALSLAAASVLAAAPVTAFAVEGGAGAIGETGVADVDAAGEPLLPHADAVPS